MADPRRHDEAETTRILRRATALTAPVPARVGELARGEGITLDQFVDATAAAGIDVDAFVRETAGIFGFGIAAAIIGTVIVVGAFGNIAPPRAMLAPVLPVGAWRGAQRVFRGVHARRRDELLQLADRLAARAEEPIRQPRPSQSRALPCRARLRPSVG